MKYSEWKNVKLSDIADITMGQSPKSEFYNNEGIGIEFLQGNRTFGRIYPDYDTWCTKPSRIAEEGSVLMSVRAPVGDLNIANKRVCIGRGLCSLKTKNNNNNMFLYYLLEYNKRNMINNQTGTIFGSINKSFIESMQVRIPKSILEQEKIMETLSTIDYKIELNNKINNNLEELAQTLYKHWFVDFEFPNEEGLPYKSSGGKMVDSELGLIPDGWEVKEVIDLFNFVGGSQPPKKEHIYENKEGYVRFIQNRDYSGNDNHITYIKESPRNKLCDETDIMMDKYGEAGKVRFGISGAYNVALAKIDSKDVDKEYLRRYFEQSSIENYILNASQASTRPSVNQTVFTNLKVAYPPTKLLNKFNEISRNIIIKTLLYRSENKKLAEMRDLLLPKLMSGEIRLPIEE